MNKPSGCLHLRMFRLLHDNMHFGAPRTRRAFMLHSLRTALFSPCLTLSFDSHSRWPPLAWMGSEGSPPFLLRSSPPALLLWQTEMANCPLDKAEAWPRGVCQGNVLVMLQRCCAALVTLSSVYREGLSVWRFGSGRACKLDHATVYGAIYMRTLKQHYYWERYWPDDFRSALLFCWNNLFWVQWGFVVGLILVNWRQNASCGIYFFFASF